MFVFNIENSMVITLLVVRRHLYPIPINLSESKVPKGTTDNVLQSSNTMLVKELALYASSHRFEEMYKQIKYFS